MCKRHPQHRVGRRCGTGSRVAARRMHAQPRSSAAPSTAACWCARRATPSRLAPPLIVSERTDRDHRRRPCLAKFSMRSAVTRPDGHATVLPRHGHPPPAARIRAHCPRSVPCEQPAPQRDRRRIRSKPRIWRNLLHPSHESRRPPSATARSSTSAPEGVYLWDNHGRQYLEGMAGLWCTALGYGEEELVQAAERRSCAKLSYSQLFAGKTNEPSVLLGREAQGHDALRRWPGDSSASPARIANDTQVKLMWYYHNLIGKPERKKIIARRSGLPWCHSRQRQPHRPRRLPSRSSICPFPGILHTDSPALLPGGAREGESPRTTSPRAWRTNLDDLIRAEGAGHHRSLHRRTGARRRVASSCRRTATTKRSKPSCDATG